MLAFSVASLTLTAQALTEQERDAAEDYLENSAKNLKKSFKDLSPAQLNWSPGEGQWSVADCVKHLAASEAGLRQMLDGFMAATANPEKRGEIKMTDADMVKAMESRERKVKTMTPLEPQNTSYKTLEEAWDDFEKKRESLSDWVEDTDQPLRSHIGAFPMGMVDAYQLVMMIAAHTVRHTAQIEAIKAMPDFPKS